VTGFTFSVSGAVANNFKSLASHENTLGKIYKTLIFKLNNCCALCGDVWKPGGMRQPYQHDGIARAV
jgi:hypothetical protein